MITPHASRRRDRHVVSNGDRAEPGHESSWLKRTELAGSLVVLTRLHRADCGDDVLNATDDWHEHVTFTPPERALGNIDMTSTVRRDDVEAYEPFRRQPMVVSPTEQGKVPLHLDEEALGRPGNFSMGPGANLSAAGARVHACGAVSERDDRGEAPGRRNIHDEP